MNVDGRVAGDGDVHRRIAGGTTVNGLNITVSGDGIHLVACTVTDEGGNPTEATATVNLDATSPTVVGRLRHGDAPKRRARPAPW